MAELRLVADDAAGRLDQFLARALPAWSRTRLQALIRAGAVSVGGQPVTRPGARLAAGDAVGVGPELELPAQPSTLTPEAIPLEVIYEDDDLAVINKPVGLVVHPGAGRATGTLVQALLHRFGELSQGGAPGRPGIVHRLDRETSGVMVVARTDAAQRALSAQFQARTVSKHYWALVEGELRPARGDIRLAIGRDRHNRLKMRAQAAGARTGPVWRSRLPRQAKPLHAQAAAAGAPEVVVSSGARAAHTSYQVRERFEAAPAAGRRKPFVFSWVELELHTGRTHQIRAHMAALHHPVVGDRLYGASAVLALQGVPDGLRPPRPMLHASRLEFEHPRTGAVMAFSAPIPDDIERLLAGLRRLSRPEAAI